MTYKGYHKSDTLLRKKISENLRYLRTKAHLSKEDLAKKLRVNVNTYKNWEDGISLPKLPRVIRIADIYKISLDSLVGRNFENDK